MITIRVVIFDIVENHSEIVSNAASIAVTTTSKNHYVIAHIVFVNRFFKALNGSMLGLRMCKDTFFSERSLLRSLLQKKFPEERFYHSCFVGLEHEHDCFWLENTCEFHLKDSCVVRKENVTKTILVVIVALWLLGYYTCEYMYMWVHYFFHFWHLWGEYALVSGLPNQPYCCVPNQ